MTESAKKKEEFYWDEREVVEEPATARGRTSISGIRSFYWHRHLPLTGLETPADLRSGEKFEAKNRQCGSLALGPTSMRQKEQNR